MTHIQTEAFILTITGISTAVHGWTADLLNSTMPSVNQIWQSQANITFDLGSRVVDVSMAAGEFPGGANWETNTLTEISTGNYSLMTENALYFAIGHINRTHPRESPFRVRIILLPSRARSVSWAGRTPPDRAECFIPRPASDDTADIIIAHELGHILAGPEHHHRATNLMFPELSNITRPPQLDDEQRARIASSLIVVNSGQQETSRVSPPIDSRARDRRSLDPTTTVAMGSARGYGGILGSGSSRGPLGAGRDVG